MSDLSGSPERGFSSGMGDEIKMIVLDDNATSTIEGPAEPTAPKQKFSIAEVAKYTVILGVLAVACWYGYRERYNILDQYPRAENGALEQDPPPYLKTANVERNTLLTSLLSDPKKKAIHCIRVQELLGSKGFQALPEPTRKQVIRVLEELIGADIPLVEMDEVVIVNDFGPTRSAAIVTTLKPINQEKWLESKHYFETAGQAEIYIDKVADGRSISMFCILNDKTLLMCNRRDTIHEIIQAAADVTTPEKEFDLPKGLIGSRIPDLTKNAQQNQTNRAGAAQGAATAAIQETGPRTNLDIFRQVMRSGMTRWSGAIKGMESTITDENGLKMEIKCVAPDPSKAFAMTDAVNGIKSRFLTYVVSKATPDVPKAFDQVNPLSKLDFKIEGSSAQMKFDLDAKLLEAVVCVLPKEHRVSAATKPTPK